MSLDFSLYYTCDGHNITVYDNNITHNLTEMADEAGIYDLLWRPKENGYGRAHSIAHKLEKGIKLLKDNPKKFEKLNPENKWGSYENLIEFAESVLDACNEYPNAFIDSDV